MTPNTLHGTLGTVLVLQEPPVEVLRKLDAGGGDEAAVQSHPVLARWSRAAGLGVRADSGAYPRGTTRAELRDRRELVDEAFREGRALFEPIAAQLAERSLVSVVADADGVILVSHGGKASGHPAMSARLVEGARWSEDVRGTNAIGTAIVERRSVAVLGGAHFEHRNRGLFCYAKPIVDAYGALVCVLDVTGPMALHDPAVGLAVETAGASLERALRTLAFAQSGRGALAAIERLVQRSSGPTLLVEAGGAVRIANAAARTALRSGAEDALTCQRIFGCSFEELVAIANNGGSGVRFETPGACHRVDLDLLAGDRGRPLAVLVHLEAEPRTRRAPPAPVRRPSHAAFDTLLAEDDGVLAAKDHATRLAPTNLPVLFLAETGTGKELFARALHLASTRASGPFVALNCGALASGVLESELFGYAPGAFTGALRSGSMGKLGAADGGTLFLDEIADMPEALQAALLRVLDDGVYHRVGDTKPSRADFRLVCATCRDLPKLVEQGSFRRDLFYRIHGGSITIPRLRDRSDRLFLARGLLARLSAALPAELTADAEAWILEHDWPGNVRELKSSLVHAVAIAGGDPVTRAHFPRVLLGGDDARRRGPGGRSRDDIPRDAVREAMRASGGNVAEAARQLGVARTTVYRALRDDDRD